ncbi:MAG: hypothetical protein FJ095_15345 [Deltaproteobacteria bacterium]|nr:hypothetical protein [Deltaproteobacteria bacterium]
MLHGVLVMATAYEPLVSIDRSPIPSRLPDASGGAGRTPRDDATGGAGGAGGGAKTGL